MPAVIPLIILAAGTAVQVVGQIKAGNAAKRAGAAQQEAANSEAGLAEYNAQVADLQKADAIDRGAEEEARFRQGIGVMVGAQRAGIAAGNIDVNVGSAVDVQADAAYLGELDALTIRTNAAREAWGYQVQGEDLRQRAAIARKTGVYLAEAGKEQQKASRYAAVSTVIGGAADATLLSRRYGFGTHG